MRKLILIGVGMIYGLFALGQGVPAELSINGQLESIRLNFDLFQEEKIIADAVTNRIYDPVEVEFIRIFQAKYFVSKNDSSEVKLLTYLLDGTVSVVTDRSLKNAPLYVLKDGSMKLLESEEKFINNQRILLPHYQGVLKTILLDCADVTESEIEKALLRTESILKLVTHYNTACGTQEIMDDFEPSRISETSSLDYSEATIVMQADGYSLTIPIHRNQFIQQGIIKGYDFRIPGDMVTSVRMNSQTYVMKSYDGKYVSVRKLAGGIMSLYAGYSALGNDRLFVEKGEHFRELRIVQREVAQQIVKTVEEYKGTLKILMSDCQLNSEIEKLRLNTSQVTDLVRKYNACVDLDYSASRDQEEIDQLSEVISSGEESSATPDNQQTQKPRSFRFGLGAGINGMVGNFFSNEYLRDVNYKAMALGVRIPITRAFKSRWSYDYQLAVARAKGESERWYVGSASKEISYDQLLLRSYFSLFHTLWTQGQFDLKLGLTFGFEQMLVENSETVQYGGFPLYQVIPVSWKNDDIDSFSFQFMPVLNASFGKFSTEYRLLRITKIRDKGKVHESGVNQGLEHQIGLVYYFR